MAPMEMKLIPPQEMGKEVYWHTKTTFGQLKKPRSRSFPKTYMGVVQKKKQANVEKLIREKNNKTSRKVFG